MAVFAPFSTARRSQERAETGDLDQVKPMLEALSRSISSLSSSAHRTLLDALVGLAWTNFDDAVARAYVGFICAFVAGRPEWLSRVVDRTIEAFKPRALCLRPTSLTSQRRSRRRRSTRSSLGDNRTTAYTRYCARSLTAYRSYRRRS